MVTMFCASCKSTPQLTAGGCMPNPKKLNAVSPRIMPGIIKVRVTIRWLVKEGKRCTARIRASFDPARRAAHLLRLPGDAMRVAARWTSDGRPILELIRLQVDAEQLLDTWRQAGWKIKTSVSGGGEFDYVCLRGGETIHAWAPRGARVVRMLVLTSGPVDTEHSD